MLYDENDNQITGEQKWENDVLDYADVLLKKFNNGQITNWTLLL